MSKTYSDLQTEIAQLTVLAEEARKNEIGEAKDEIFRIMAKYSITVDELLKSGKVASTKPKTQVAAIYRDPESGATWSGRGRAPRWLDGKDRNNFKIVH